MPWSIIFVIAGVVLKANDEWFDGAETVGTICLVFGGLGLLFTLLVLLGVGAAMFGGSRRKGWRRF